MKQGNAGEKAVSDPTKLISETSLSPSAPPNNKLNSDGVLQEVPACFQKDHIQLQLLRIPPLQPGMTVPTKTSEDIMKLIKQDKLKEAKALLRIQHWPLDYKHRPQLWMQLCQYQKKQEQSDDFYKTTVQETLGDMWPMGLPAFSDPLFCEDYLLNELAQKKVERLLYVISVAYPYITYCPVLHPLSSVFLHFIDEESAYRCMCSLIEGTQVRHLSQTRIMHDTSACALQQLTKKLAAKTYKRLQKRLKSEEALEKVFHTWELWIFRGLPLYHLVRTIDCFLLEGVRALYRAALAILILYCQTLGDADASNQGILSRFFSRSSTANAAPPPANPSPITATTTGPKKDDETVDPGAFLDQIIDFCKEMPYNVERFLKTAYSIQGISTKLLNQQLLEAEMRMRSSTTNRTRTASTGGIPVSGSFYHLQINSNSLTVKEIDVNSLAFIEMRKSAQRSMSVGIMQLGNFKSDILNHEQLATLWSWLPARITMLQPELIYSTNEQGCSLRNLFFQVETWEPTIFLIRNTHDEVFGAYCSTKWAERGNHPFFGTGETFLFTFVSEAPRKYPWVGANVAKDVAANEKMFLSANQDMIQVGGGNGFGLYLDANLEKGRTERCDTFRNEPLCAHQDFIVKVFEVLGFA